MNLLPVRIALIVARADNGTIGADGALPWKIAADLQHFKRLTLGKPVIMGRKTYDSIGRPLPRRTNIVVSRNIAWRADGVIAATDVATALAVGFEDALRTGVDEVMVIGGAAIYSACLERADRIYLTEVHRDYVGDTAFDLPASTHWRETARHLQPADSADGPTFSFVTLERAG